MGLKKIHWVAWQKIDRPVQESGLGLRIIASYKHFPISSGGDFKHKNHYRPSFYIASITRGYPRLVQMSSHEGAMWKRICKLDWRFKLQCTGGWVKVQ